MPATVMARAPMSAARKSRSVGNRRTFESSTRRALATPGRTTSKRQAVTMLSDANIIISSCNAGMLVLGRTVFSTVVKDRLAAAGKPSQNGVSHFDAGDARAEEMTGLFKTGDAAGFTLIDLLAWGSLGHAVGFAALVLSK